MIQLTDLHFHLPRFRGILWAAAGNADRIEVEDTLESMAIFIDVLFIDWILSFVLAAITKALRPQQQHHSWHANP